MLEATTSGLAQPKHKTINAEVNLLAEWQRARDRVHEQIVRVAAGLTLLGLLAFGTVPVLFRTSRAADARLKNANASLSQTQAQLSGLEAARKAAKPRIDEGAMSDTVRLEATEFLGHTIGVINSASAGMAFETITADVIGGELTLRCKADAESNAVVQTFLSQAGGGPNVNSTLLATAQRNARLSKDGVGFEYVKRIGVTP